MTQSKGYQSTARGLALGSLAMAAAALTMGAMVVLPAELESGNFEQAAWFAASAAPSRLVAVDADCADEPATNARERRFDARADAERVLSREKR